MAAPPVNVAIGPLLQDLLTRYGLSTLAPWVSDQIVRGNTMDQIVLQLYDRPEFKAVFPEIEARRKLAQDSGLNMAPISVDDVLNYRAQARSMMQSYGLPPTFYSNNAAFSDLIVNDVSLDELSWRLENVSARVHNAPPEVRQTFDQLFGDGSDAAMFALFVDADKAMPELENMIQQAEAGGAGLRMGFALTPASMARLEQTNLSYNQFLEGFTVLDATRGLYEETILEEVEDLDALEEGIAGVFGLEPGAQQQVNRRAEERVTSTKGHSGGALTEQGATGLGGAGRR